MSPEKFMNKRRDKTFTATEIMYFLSQRGYRFRLMDTHIPKENFKKIDTKDYICICWPNQTEGDKGLCDAINKLGIPKHFAYIKFYVNRTYKESADAVTNHIYALEVGKTNHTNVDLGFATLKVLEKSRRTGNGILTLSREGIKRKGGCMRRRKNSAGIMKRF